MTVAVLTALLCAGGMTQAGAIPGLIGGDLTDPTDSGMLTGSVIVSAQKGGEEGTKAFDNDKGTKWYTNPTSTNHSIQFRFDNPTASYAVDSYTISSANDDHGRDPKDWTLFGSNDGAIYTPLHTVTNEQFTARFETREFTFTNTTDYEYYKFEITADYSSDQLQLSEIELFDSSYVPPVVPTDVTAPGDPVVGLRNTVAGGPNGDQANWPGGEPPANAINNTFAKYLNFGEVKTGQVAGENTGLYVTPLMGSTVLDGMRFASANDNPARDPMTYTLEGTNGNPASAAWTLIDSGATGLTTARNTLQDATTFVNTDAYTSYRLLFPTVRGTGQNSMQIGEVQFLGILDPNAPPPPESVFYIGVDNGNQGEFDHEDNADDHYYWEDGDYSALGTGGANWSSGQEPWSGGDGTIGFDRALLVNDPINYIYFQLEGLEAAADAQFSFISDMREPNGTHDLAFYMNGVLFHTETGIGEKTVMDTFTGADVGAVAGSNFIEIVRTGPSTSGGWIQFDYLSLTVVPGAPNAIPEPMTMLAVGLGIAGLGGYIRKRRRA